MSDDPGKTEMDGFSNVEIDTRRKVKLTSKALEEKLEKRMKVRKRVLTRLVSKAEEIENLMKNDANAYLVEKDNLSDYSKFLNEFIEANNAVSELLPDDEKEADQLYWRELNLTKFENFLAKIEQWIVEVRQQAEAVTEHATPDRALHRKLKLLLIT